MIEFFVVANSFAAPFLSDTSEHYVTAETPQAALEQFALDYSHPCGLYAARAYRNVDAFHKREKYLAEWISNHALALEEHKAPYSYLGKGAGSFEIDGVPHEIQDPKGGRVQTPEART
jgi:hypothetical protein